MRYRQRLAHFGGLLTLITVAFFVMAGPIAIIAVALVIGLMPYLLPMLLLVCMAQAMLANVRRWVEDRL